jgi:hypothetical protein
MPPYTYKGENSDAGDNTKPVDDQVTDEEAKTQKQLDTLHKRLSKDNARRTTDKKAS